MHGNWAVPETLFIANHQFGPCRKHTKSKEVVESLIQPQNFEAGWQHHTQEQATRKYHNHANLVAQMSFLIHVRAPTGMWVQ